MATPEPLLRRTLPRRRLLPLLLGPVALLLGSGTTAARAEEARERIEGERLDRLWADIGRARRDVRTLRAAFTQTRKIGLLAASIRSQGDLWFAADGRLRWQLAPPDDVTYFVGPEGLTYKTRASSSTLPPNAAAAARALADLRALLGGDLGSLRPRYTLSATRSPVDVEIHGVAKDATAAVRGFTLVLDQGLVLPIRTRLLEGKADSIDITFSGVVVNAPIDAATLRP